MAEPHDLAYENRLTRMETLLETIDRRLGSLETHIKAVEAAQRTTDQDYQKMKNQGAGLLVGISMLAGALGANFDRIVARLLN